MAAKLSCEACKFKWDSASGKIPNHCPYCGKENRVIDLEGSQAKFVDVDDLLR